MRHNAKEEPIEGEVVNERVHDEPREPAPKADTTVALVVYALYLANFFTGFTVIVGVIVSYVYHGNGPHWLDEHYRYQIRTFWIGLLYLSVASLLTLVLIGFPLLLAVAVWFIVRCVKGFKGIQEKRPPSDVNGWLL
ncbi:DUF4870 family protein [Halomonas sp. HMF6819]|uniref:DUF4870 family protein n=1 Tax=Halomonas sp. HMF6819 TaxID=3373085 RepID=UPI0037A6974D